jgi:hypothetical protein
MLIFVLGELGRLGIWGWVLRSCCLRVGIVLLRMLRAEGGLLVFLLSFCLSVSKLFFCFFVVFVNLYFVIWVHVM